MTTQAGTGPNLPDLLVLPDGDALAAAAGEEIARALAAAIAERGVAHWATTGGSAAPGMYRALRSAPVRATVDWSRVHIWWGDDRFVGPGDPLSNVLSYRTLFEADGEDGPGIAIPAAQVHPVPVAETIAAGGGPAEAAAAYARTLAVLAPSDAAGTPVLDLLVLGVGPDGHVLSVFPGSSAWDATAAVVAIPAPTHIEPHVPRVSLNPRVIAAARRILVVAGGASKAANLGRAWTGDDLRAVPVAATRRSNATWLLDAAAAAELPRT
ncbi:MAG: 6-phosphogluconolactonase [Chloroflexota bacterium]